MKNLPIGVFDSGVGGLTVLQSLREKLPQEAFLYYADTAHVPYGEKSAQEVFAYVQEIVSFLIQQGVKAIVMGCNLSSCIALSWARETFDIPIYGLVEPAAREAVVRTKSGRIGVLCTPATAATKGYEEAILALNPRLSVFTLPCQPFVPLVERGASPEEAQEVVASTVQPLQGKEIDTLVYGCSHYPFLEREIAACFPQATFVNPAPLVAQEVADSLNAFRWLREECGKLTLFASGSTKSLQALGGALLGETPLPKKPRALQPVPSLPVPQPQQADPVRLTPPRVFKGG